MKQTTKKYFNESGCLTLEALEKYLANELEGEELKIVRSHLNECELCSDALEGFELVRDKDKLNSMISEINENLNSGLRRSSNVRQIGNDRLFYYSAAAIIIILFGLLSYFKFAVKNFGDDIQLYSEKKKVEMPVPKSPEKTTKKVIEQGEKENIPKVDKREKLQYITVNIKDVELDDVWDEELEISVDEEPGSKSVAKNEPASDDNGFLIDMVVINSDANVASGPSAPPAHIQQESNSETGKNNVPKEEFTIVETMPGFPGGETGLKNYLEQNLKYPSKAREKKVEGKIYVSFVVNTSGKVTNVEIIKGIDPECDNEAISIIKNMPLWKPGKQQGKPVNVRFVLPICFKLN